MTVYYVEYTTIIIHLHILKLTASHTDDSNTHILGYFSGVRVLTVYSKQHHMMTDIGHMQVLEISGVILLRTSVEGNSNSKQMMTTAFEISKT